MHNKTHLIIVSLWLTLAGMGLAENIDPDNTGSQFAWSENAGWLNFEPGLGPGVQVYRDRIEGFVWSENLGWINLAPTYGGVLNDGAGNLSGFAWSENAGWINFSPQVPNSKIDYGVKIDSGGQFYGWAWGENIGWIRFRLKTGAVRVCMVSMMDLADLAARWLDKGTDPHGSDSGAFMPDFAWLSTYWLDYCPQ